MRHAGADTLAALSPLLAALRRLPGLVERRPGVFYRRGRACLHFHDDAAGVFADLRLDGPDFTRWRVSGAAEQAALLAQLQLALAAPAPAAPPGD